MHGGGRAPYSAVVDTVVPAKGTKEAEMAKLLKNTFRHVNIALMNEMVRFSNELGLVLWESINRPRRSTTPARCRWPPDCGGR